MSNYFSYPCIEDKCTYWIGGKIIYFFTSSLFVSNFSNLDKCWKKRIPYNPDIVVFISIYNYNIYCYTTFIFVLESILRISAALESSGSIYLKSLCQNHKQIIDVPAPPSFTTFSHLRELQIEKQIKSKRARNTSLQGNTLWKLIALDHLMRDTV